MKKFYTLVLLLNVGLCFAQNPSTKQWDYRFGGTSYDYLKAPVQTTDGGFLLGGSSQSGIGGDKTESSRGLEDYWIVKIDSLGNKQWDKRYGGNHGDQLSSAQKTKDGGYILGGASWSGISGDKTQTSRGESDYWIVKIDSIGNLQWDKRFGGIDHDWLSSLQQTTDGGYILGGSSKSGISGDKTQPSWGYWDYWIVKTDSIGNLQWEKRFGGTDWEEMLSVIQIADGGFILGGYSVSGISGDKTQPSWGGSDFWIVKTDSLGNMQWDKRLGGTGADYFHKLQQTQDKGYILAGQSWSGIGGDKSQPSWGYGDYWIVKTDSFGNYEWDKRYGGISGEGSISITQSPDKGYLIAGASMSDISGDKSEDNLGLAQMWIVKTDSLCNKIWDKTILTNGEDYQVGFAFQTNSNCYLMCNFTDANTGGYKTQDSWNNSFDIWIIKFCDTSFFSPPQSLLNASGNTSCSPFCVNFTDQSTNNPFSWEWIFDGGLPSTSFTQNPNDICYSVAGTYDVTLITTNNNGSDTLTLPDYISVYLPPVSPGVVQNQDTLVSSYADNYQWFLNSFIIPGATNQTLVIFQTGLYTLIITDSSGCSAQTDITVIGLPPFTAFTASDTLPCEKFCIDFHDASSNNPLSWQWIFSGANPSTSYDQDPVNICYDNPGTYDVNLITSNALGTDTLILQGYITVQPTPPFPTIIQNGYTLTSSPSSFYQWQFNGVDIAGATNQSYTLNQTGFYTILITDLSGCQNSATLYVDLTGIDENFMAENFSLYPNPSNGNFVIECSSHLPDGLLTITLINTLGIKVFIGEEEFHSSQQRKEIELHGISSGLYYLEIKTSAGTVMKKIMIDR